MPTQRSNPLQDRQPLIPADYYEHLCVAAPRQRNRNWEKTHQSQKVIYRGVDPNLALRVKQIAGDLEMRDGDVARSLLDYALCAYAEGDLNLNPRPHPRRMRMTLFPAAETIGEKHRRDGRPVRKKKLKEPRWRVVITWRGFPPALKQEIASLASEAGLNVPAGELVTALLRFSLKAFENGLLKVGPVAEANGYPPAERFE